MPLEPSEGRAVPRISELFGITIAMYYNDHATPHFHAKYTEYEATVAIDTLELLSGTLPNRVLGLALEWAALHRLELRENWEAARHGEPLERIAGLE